MKLIDEFKTFAVKGNAVELAIGVVIGAAFGAITTSLVDDIISPPLGLLIGGIDFSKFTFPLTADVVIRYGAFIQSLINFLIVAFVMFLVVKAMNQMKRNEEAAAPTKSAELLVLEEIRDAVKK